MELLQNLSTEQLVDIAFGLLVAGICIKTLFFGKGSQKKQRKLWKEELQELETSLKSLITEASDAAGIFDKNIRHRQNELRSLLEKADRTITEARLLQENNHNTDSLILDKQNISPDTASTHRMIEDPPWVDSETEDKTVADKVQASLSKAVKGSSLRYKTLSSLGKIDSSGSDSSSSLNNQIEVEKEEEENIDHEIFQQTSIVDPVAFRIAKRLLLEGKELHIVARKLELPVSEIRHLESLLRERSQKENRPLPKALAEKEIRRVRGIVRDPLEKETHNSFPVKDRSQVSESLPDSGTGENTAEDSQLF
jgi:hypothetical protein